ncbi:MAG: ClbS/DfsB family four-helix bundle protein [Anaerolineae bacterium]|nr:ClbS/DfsB family four-helix bundle protein [Anaerolineae bacterium]
MSEHDDPKTKAELLQRIDQGWEALQTFIASLTEAQMTGPTDAAGWTVKDHLIHLAVWENSIVALLKRQMPRREALGLDEATWMSGDFDRMNAVIQQQQQAMPLDAVLKRLNEVHQQMLDTLQPMSDADLQRPYSAYQPPRSEDGPIMNWVIGDTYSHFSQHIGWMDAIITG